MTVSMQIILFFALVAEGALVRLIYKWTEKPRGRIKRKPLAVACDVLVALLGAGVMFVTCFLVAGSVRVFYAVFFLGGAVITHFILPKTAPKTETSG